MANYRAVANGNWSAGATWAGGAVPPNSEGHNIYSNNFTVTIDQNVNVALITNAAVTASFVGGGTSAAVGGGFACSTTNLTLNLGIIALGSTLTSALTTSGSANLIITANIPAVSVGPGSTVNIFTNSSTGTIIFNGNINAGALTFPGIVGLLNTSSGTVNINGNLTGGLGNSINALSYAVHNSASGTIIVNSGTITGCTSSSASVGYGLHNSASGSVILNNCIINALFIPAINNASTGSLTAINSVFTAANGAAAVNSTNTSATNRFSGTFISSLNGTQPINATKWILGAQPLNAYIQHARDGITANSFDRFYTSDNSTALNQAAPTDVRSGVAYGISNSQTGRLTVPARGSVALSVNYGPSMPFTAIVSGTTATATLAYSYPLVVGDSITVTGASNSEWNSTYTIASVVSGTSVTFTVPNTHSATAGTGALMQTTGTAALDPAAVASAVWGAASRTITGGVVDTATTLTNAPTVPTPAEIRAEMDSSSTKLANLDASVSSRLATSGYTAPTSAPSVADIRTELAVELGRLDASVSSRLASSAYTAPTTPPTAAQIATAVEGSLLNEADGQAVLNAIVGAIGNTNLSEVSLVAAVRADLERTGGKLDSIPTTSAPSASAVAGAVRTELGVELGRIDAAISSRLAPNGTLATVTTLTNAPTSVTPSDIWSHSSRTLTTSSGPTAVEIRQEIDANSTKLDAAVSSRMAASEATKLDAVKAKTDLLNTDRLANVATTNIVGTLLAQANS